MTARTTVEAMSDDDFLNHVLWLLVDGGETLPETRKRATALVMSRQARGATRGADADGGCTPEFPCQHCADCDAEQISYLASFLASFVIPTPRSIG